MRRWLIGMALIAAGAAVAGGGAGRLAAGAEGSATTVLISQTSLDDIYRKLEEITQHQRQQGRGDAAKQLDQVLKNQEAIMAELQIIKVRASRR